MRKLMYSLILMVIIATFGIGWLVDIAYEQYQTNDERKDVDKLNLIEQLGSGLAVSLDQMPNQAHFVEQWQQSGNDIQIDVAAVASLPLPSSLLAQIKQGEAMLLETNEHLTFYYWLPISNAILTLKTPSENTASSQSSVNYVFTLLFYLALILLLLLWSYPLAVSLVKLRKTTKQFGEGDLTQRLKISPASYIGEIETEFNNMAQRIEDLVSDVKMLSSAVSHDLRTPLAKIQFGIDTLQEEKDSEVRESYFKKISTHVAEMNSLVNTLLDYARLERSMLTLDKQKVNLSLITENCVKSAEQDAITFRFSAPPTPLFISASPAYITMLINNLLQNAITYGNGIVEINVTLQDKHALIVVADNGKGISKKIAQQNDLLKPFVRGHDRKNKGHGFGLAVVKRVLDWHEGSIDIGHSSTLFGAQFSAKLPIDE